MKAPCLAACSALLLLAAAPASADFSPGLTTDNIFVHSTGMRTYDLYVPASYDGNTPSALVVDLHGFTSDSDGQRGISGWLGLSDAEGFLVVWPDGLFNSWNAGLLCCGSARDMDIDDVGFISALTLHLAGVGNIDTNRIYATGLSNGGAMSQRLACDANEVFAATAPLAFPIPWLVPMTECQPGRAVPVITFQGLTDSLVPYLGFGGFPSALQSFERWRDVDGCGAGPPDVHIDLSSGAPGTFFCDRYTSCASGVEVELCSLTGLDFSPPFDAFNGHILYLNTDGVDVTDLAWQFLEQYTLPDADADADADGVPDSADNCPFVPNPAQTASTQYSSVGCACLCGDANRDCLINVADAGEALRAGLIPPLPPLSPSFDVDFCDLNADGICNVGDSPEMARAGLVPPLPPLTPGFDVTGCPGYLGP